MKGGLWWGMMTLSLWPRIWWGCYKNMIIINSITFGPIQRATCKIFIFVIIWLMGVEGKAFFEGNHMNVWWIWGCRRGRRCRLRGRRMSLVLLWYMKSGGSFLNIWDCCSFCSQWTRMVSWIWVNFHTKR